MVTPPISGLCQILITLFLPPNITYLFRKIELITSYHNNSDSESNDETEKPPKTSLPPKLPSKPPNPVKKQKTKPVVEYGPPLPPNQNYTIPIGPELPPELTVKEKPKSPTVKPASEATVDQVCNALCSES